MTNVVADMKFMRFITILVFFLAIAANFACQQKAEDGSKEPPPSGFPVLTDKIPYEKLGQGKLVFERLGPIENNYSGIYVIDIINQSSWGIGSGVFDGPAVSPNGQKIAFARLGPGNYDIHVMNIDGSNIQRVGTTEWQDRSPSWTPDSTQILFWGDSQEPLLYRQSPVPNPVDKTLIKTFSIEGNKLWALKGPFSVSKNWRLTFAAYFSASPWGLYTMDIDGTNLSGIASANLFSPAWSPDGQKIAYLVDSTVPKFLELILMDANGRNPRSLVKFDTTNATGSWYGQNDLSLCWSPDGSKIAFNKKENGNLISHIYIINSDGSGLTQVTFADGVTDRSLSWSIL